MGDAPWGPTSRRSAGTGLMARVGLHRVTGVNRDLDSAILPPALFVVVGGDGLALTPPPCAHPCPYLTLRGQIARRGHRAALRQILVVAVGADVVRMAHDQQLRARVLPETARQLVEVRASGAENLVGIEAEQ